MRPTQKKWWGYDLDTHLRHLGPSVGPPVPFSWVNLPGKLIEESLEAHSGTNTSCLSYIGKPAVGQWEGATAKGFPRAGGTESFQHHMESATRPGSARSLTWGFALRGQNLSPSGWQHFRLSGPHSFRTSTISGTSKWLSRCSSTSRSVRFLIYEVGIHPSKGPNLPWTLARRSRCPSSANTAWSRFTVQSRSAPNYWVRALYIFAI